MRRPVSLARSDGESKSNRGGNRGEGRHFCHFCLVRPPSAPPRETAAIAAKVHRARGVEGDQPLHPFTQQIYTIRSFTSTSRCRCSFSCPSACCLHRKSVCHRQKERVRERERASGLTRSKNVLEMGRWREGGAGRKEGREGECNFSTKCSSSRIVARSRSICEKEKGAPSEREGEREHLASQVSRRAGRVKWAGNRSLISSAAKRRT